MRKMFIFEIVVSIISVALTLYLYDWKLLLILIVYGYYLNMMNRRNFLETIKQILKNKEVK